MHVRMYVCSVCTYASMQGMHRCPLSENSNVMMPHTVSVRLVGVHRGPVALPLRSPGAAEPPGRARHLRGQGGS